MPLQRFALALALTLAVAALGAAGGPPTWAYPSTPSAFHSAPDDASKHRVPGSIRQYTAAQIGDAFAPADWFPGEHPLMPDPVGRGRRPAVKACASCHLPNGRGLPQTATLAGLPADYIAAQLNDFALGNRLPAVGSLNIDMGAIARAMTPVEVKSASQYFARLKPIPWIKVVETATSPATEIVDNDLVVPVDGGGTEPTDQRIVEVPDIPARARLYDSHVAFTAYVPAGSLNRGRNLVRTGGASMVRGKATEGKTKKCSDCHGLDLRGMPAKPDGTPISPSLVGRSPSYTFRQLYDIQHGARKGPNIPTTMRSVVAQLNEADMIDIAAYLASRMP